MCDTCKREREERMNRASHERSVIFYEAIIDDLRQKLHDLAGLMVDAEMITRSRCHELTNMSNADIVAIFQNSPISQDAAKTCISIAEEQAAAFKPGSWDQQACLSVASAIRVKFRLSV